MIYQSIQQTKDLEVQAANQNIGAIYVQRKRAAGCCSASPANSGNISDVLGKDTKTLKESRLRSNVQTASNILTYSKH